MHPHSPSPIRRVGPTDNNHPPLKRVHEEPPYSVSYYTPQPQRISAGGPTGDYPSHPLPPPQPTSQASCYNSCATLVSPPSGAGAPQYERDYPLRDRPTNMGSYASRPLTYECTQSLLLARAPLGGVQCKG